VSDIIIASIITGVLGLLGGFLPARFFFYKPPKKASTNENANKDIPKFDKTLFADTKEMDIYYAGRIKSAKREILSLMWQDNIDDPVEFNPERRMRQEGIDQSICSFCKDRNKIFRELFTFSFPARYNFMRTRVGYGINYECRYSNNFSHSVKERFPKLQFRIIDDEEVIFASRAYHRHLCAIKDENLVGIMRIYFEMAWNTATRIAPAQDIEMNNTFSEIEKGIKEYLARF
jgi:hypothetical protein